MDIDELKKSTKEELSTINGKIETNTADIASLLLLTSGKFTKTLLAGGETAATRIKGGDITLAQSWEDFDFIQTYFEGDDNTIICSSLVPVWELKARQEFANKVSAEAFFWISDFYQWCVVAKTTTGTLLKARTNSMDIYAIYGITLKGDNT